METYLVTREGEDGQKKRKSGRAFEVQSLDFRIIAAATECWPATNGKFDARRLRNLDFFMSEPLTISLRHLFKSN